jgi:hypothetical protein
MDTAEEEAVMSKWINDCNGLKKFMDNDDHPLHEMQQAQLYMLQFNFTMIHQPNAMVREVNMVTQYNKDPNKLQQMEQQSEDARLLIHYN